MAHVEVFGIRHHGPGSARSVQRALDELQPTAVVIEGPPELDGLVDLARDPSLVPPIAALVYVPDEPRRAAFYPLAAFSPEWIALRWAIGHDAVVRFADLPATNFLAPGADDDAPRTHRDPIAELAAASGYDDAERWWEDAVEQRHANEGAVARFAAVCDAFVAARDDSAVDDGTLRREAAMRRIIRSVVADHETVAIVCGAFHAPVLHPSDHPKVSADNARLTKLPKAKVAATWTPWTSNRLAYRSGYGAGVTSPGWYQHLFTHADEVLPHWFVRVAGALREAHLDVSPASVIESVRLAETLATLRGRPLAGLDEVTDSTLAVMCGGSAVPLAVVAEQLIVGHDLGTVPEATPMVPLAVDLARQQKALRLKVAAEATTVTLDLRQPSQLARSVLFHRLGVLGVDWAIATETGRTTGTFKEAWTLEWRPELAIDLIDAGLRGTTVESAATARVVEVAQDADELAHVSAAVESCLVAELPGALAPVLDALERRTAQVHDSRSLLATIEPLARTCRYGDVRGVDTTMVASVLEVLVVRASIGLPSACAALDDDAAAKLRETIESADQGISLLARPELVDPWLAALRSASDQQGVHGWVAGRIVRLLLDRDAIESADAHQRLARQLSVGSEATLAAAWLDGFISGEAVVLLHDPELMATVDDWVRRIDDCTFDDLLPLVRRTFAQYSPAERRQIGEQVKRGVGAAAAVDGDEPVDTERARPAVLAVAALLGLDVDHG